MLHQKAVFQAFPQREMPYFGEGSFAHARPFHVQGSHACQIASQLDHLPVTSKWQQVLQEHDAEDLQLLPLHALR